MYQHGAAARLCKLDKLKRLLKVLAQVLVAVVRHVQLLVHNILRRFVHRLRACYVEHVVNTQPFQDLRFAGILHVADKQEPGHLAGGVVLYVFGGGQV